MAEKLKSVLQNLYQANRNQLSLFLKSLIFGVALFWAGLNNFSWASDLFFIAIAIFLYAPPLFENYTTLYAFLILLPAAILGTRILNGSSLFIFGILSYSFIFYLLLGIKEYTFIKRSRLYYLAGMLIFYSIFIEFFLADKSELFLLKYGLVIFASFLLFREWLTIITAFSFPKREILSAGVAAFLIAQLLWATALLPIGFISSANLMLLFVFIITDFLLKHFTGGISKEFIFQQLIFFLALAALIFWTSSWNLIL